MATWREFAHASPEIAEAGKRLMHQFGVAQAFLATIRADGGPRLHPVCPVLTYAGLYVFVMPTSPKRSDLLRDGRFALHTHQPPEGDEEFYWTRGSRLIADPDARTQIAGAATHPVQDDEVLFELLPDRALHTTWENWPTPEMRPIHTTWRG